jgi:hypothetical protein
MPEQSQITVNLTSEDDFILNGVLNFFRPKKTKPLTDIILRLSTSGLKNLKR